MAKGRSGRPWQRIKADVKARGGPCCRCGQPIDYRLPYLNEVTGLPDPNSASIDHYPFPLSTHPHLAEDPSNLANAHLGCNQSASNSPVTTTKALGDPSEDW